MLFTILVSLRIIFRDIVSIFSETQSIDIIQIFFKRKKYFTKRFLPQSCEEFAFHWNSYFFSYLSGLIFHNWGIGFHRVFKGFKAKFSEIKPTKVIVKINLSSLAY